MNNSYSKRVIFPAGEQRKFIKRIARKLELSHQAMARLAGINKRTLSDWKREKYSLSLSALQKLCKHADLEFPAKAIVKEPFWYTPKGARAGWTAIFRKYGRVPINEEHRKQEWYKWWEQKGKHQSHKIIGVRKPIHYPPLSPVVAEFVGIMLGDGGITKRQAIVTLHSEDDREFATYVQQLIKNLFRVPITIRHNTNQKAMNLVISRTNLVRFCNEKLGLKIGNKLKQGLDIPAWVKQEKAYLKACLRGLIDTDGCVFFERHRIKGKVYSYPRLNFTSYSLLLTQSVMEALDSFDMRPRLRRAGKAVQLEEVEQIRQYVNVIGTNNPKHQRKLKQIKGFYELEFGEVG